MPRLESVPAHATKLAIDDVTKRIIAYDARGVHLGFVERSAFPKAKRDDVGACSSMSADDVQKRMFPAGISSSRRRTSTGVTARARSSPTTRTTPSSPPRSARRTPATSPSTATPSARRRRSLSTRPSPARTVPRPSARLPAPSSPPRRPSLVRQEASLAIGETVSVKVGIPEVADVTSTTSVEAKFTNTLSTTETSENNQQTTQTVAIAVPNGKTCKVNFDVTTCTTQGSGQVPFVATGWVWFEYDDKTEGHYKWALKIDDIVANKDDRSTFLKFDAQVKSDTNGEYKADC
ncbi:hypothetical protein EV714DRAFT_253542 [Schizophyllum commune]